MFRQWFCAAVVLAFLSGVGHAGPSEYNSGGRDMYGNTAEQNEAIQLRGVQEKARFAREKTSREKAENAALLYSLIPGAALLTAVSAAVVFVYRKK